MTLQTGSLTPEIELDRIDRLFDIRDLRIFIPGGYGAIGEAIAIGMARLGAEICVAGPSPAKAAALAGRIITAGGKAHGIELDARSPAAIAASTQAAISRMGGIDVLVNCVGIQREQAIMEVTPEIFDEIYETNLRSAMFLGQAVARDQIARGQGDARFTCCRSVRSLLCADAVIRPTVPPRARW